MEPHLHKIKLLLNLATSPNENEAATAKAMAEKLIAKYNITQEQLESIKEKDNTISAEQILFETKVHTEWKSVLAYLVASKYNCYVMQEMLVANTGESEYRYIVFGGQEDIDNVKYLFPVFVLKIEDLVSKMCYGRGEIYTSSYCEGVVNGLRSLLENYSFKVPGPKTTEQETQEEKPGLIKTDSITNPAEKPTENTVRVNEKNKVKDIMAYFKGVKDSDLIDFDSLLLEEGSEDEI